MLEITPDDIARLDDIQLRTLIGMLCEAELVSRRSTPRAATWGGNQTAADGGLDVRVNVLGILASDGFIPRAATGFQVKRQDMPRAAIQAEMAPGGRVRDVIRSLADGWGAYIIVSSQGSLADAALRHRREAMTAAVADLPNRERLALDFYDRTRITSWVRCHAGIALWARREAGRHVSGWEPFDAWAYPAGTIDAEFLVDDGIRLCKRPSETNGDMPAPAGLSALRGILKGERSVVRLVGLSGVGKTRLVQALFDARGGTDHLDPALAIYTNMNNSPDPPPLAMASGLIASQSRTILIVDNCTPDLHKRLGDVVRQPLSRLSLLTVEYDIRDDQPEDTDVFELKVASLALIEKLLRQRLPFLSPIDARSAAELSGGNARIALALAGTVQKSGTLAGLSDEDVFQRLFVQRQQEDRGLLDVAQACSLVYSYEGEDATADGELARIGSMVGASPERVFAATGELLDRDLAQRRGVWRAVLPHAIANRLAVIALRRIPRAKIDASLIGTAPDRLKKSFARRLGYLHASREAQMIVEEWLAPGGCLSDVWRLDDYDRALFSSVLPVAPEAVLAAIERGLKAGADPRATVKGAYLISAARLIAYEADYFKRCTEILRRLAIEGDEDTAKTASEAHASLFQLRLSGTHAPIALRLELVGSLLSSTDAAFQKLGLDALEACLQTTLFHGADDFQFGARPRDYGASPQSEADVDKMVYERARFCARPSQRRRRFEREDCTCRSLSRALGPTYIAR